MQGFYEEMAEFAAMTEDEGFLGQCASDITDHLPRNDHRVTGSAGGNFLPRQARQLQFLAIEKSPVFITKAG